jgi:hypothetical protein
MSVGIIGKFKFVTSAMETMAFKKYMDYMDRKEAIRTDYYKSYTIDQTTDGLAGQLRHENVEQLRREWLNPNDKQFASYNRYMGNPEKSSGLFSQTANQLTPDEVIQLKANFKLAQEKDSNMWQIVLSFDNDWLAEFGAYDKEKHLVNETEVMNAVRLGMRDVVDKSDMPSAIWSAAIHYNTKNIHVHVAMVELSPSKEKRWFIDKETQTKRFERPGYLPYSAINGLKSKVANKIVDRSKEYERFDKLIRQEMGVTPQVQERLRETYRFDRDFQVLKKAMLSDEQLKTKKFHWQYNNHLLDDYRPQIDNLTKRYIETFHQNDYVALCELISKNGEYLKGAYGDTAHSKKMQADYHDKKLGELNTRLGQAVIREIRAQDKAEQTHKQTSSAQTHRFVNLSTLRRAFKKSWLEISRDRDYERLRHEMADDLEYI